MVDRLRDRLAHILDAIAQIEHMAAGGPIERLRPDAISMAALERFLEIINEASRHIPEQRKASTPEIPWREIADIGNRLRHAYSSINPEILFNIYESGQLAALKQVAIRWASELRIDENGDGHN